MILFFSQVEIDRSGYYNRFSIIPYQQSAWFFFFFRIVTDTLLSKDPFQNGGEVYPFFLITCSLFYEIEILFYILCMHANFLQISVFDISIVF